MSTKPTGANTRRYDRVAPLTIHSPNAAIPQALPLPYPSTIREALRANHEQVTTMLANTSVTQYYSVVREALKSQYLANHKAIATKLEESLYIYQGVPMTDHDGAVSY
tara:strand:- start:2515 stop:2838 length:324 start_codon:yes stop_codon:yes gene_type:complete